MTQCEASRLPPDRAYISSLHVVPGTNMYTEHVAACSFKVTDIESEMHHFKCRKILTVLYQKSTKTIAFGKNV